MILSRRPVYTAKIKTADFGTKIKTNFSPKICKTVYKTALLLAAKISPAIE
jgi:hypothetical protein